jgi:L-cystine uptake protein TcyP (sodium:dicarboxylate symporter family)
METSTIALVAFAFFLGFMYLTIKIIEKNNQSQVK